MNSSSLSIEEVAKRVRTDVSLSKVYPNVYGTGARFAEQASTLAEWVEKALSVIKTADEITILDSLSSVRPAIASWTEKMQELREKITDLNE